MEMSVVCLPPRTDKQLVSMLKMDPTIEITNKSCRVPIVSTKDLHSKYY